MAIEEQEEIPMPMSYMSKDEREIRLWYVTSVLNSITRPHPDKLKKAVYEIKYIKKYDAYYTNTVESEGKKNSTRTGNGLLIECCRNVLRYFTRRRSK